MEDSDSFFADQMKTSSAGTCESENCNEEGDENIQLCDEENIVANSFVNVDAADELFSKSVESWMADDLVGKYFVSVAAAEGFYPFYSKKVGFGFRRNNKLRDSASGVITMRRWVCSRAGTRQHREEDLDKQKREPRPITRCSCEADFVVRYTQPEGYYRVTKFRTVHNHELAIPNHVHFFRCNKQITSGQAMEIRTMKEAGIRTCHIMDFMVTTLGGFKNVGFIAKDLYNFISADHERTRSLNTDAEATIAYFSALVDKDPGMYVKYSVDEDNRLSKIFWADSTSRLDYGNFGDVLVIDSTYKTNSFKMPLVEFVGLNNHRSTVVFGAALVTNESVESYVWTFNSFLHAMEDKQPVSVITDGDRAIAAALGEVMPLSRHRLCAWHLMRNARGMSHDAYFLSDFRTCMLTSQSEDSFEVGWALFRTKYSHVNNQWLDELYERKEKWAEAFLRGIFFGGMTTNQRCESMNAYMNQFLNCDLSLYTFVKQYSRAMGRLRKNVLRSDFTNQQSEMILRTHLPSIESSAASFYTRAVFLKVRNEIMKETSYTLTTISVVGGVKKMVLKKFGDKDTRDLIVSLNTHNQSLSCVCGKFESLWWPCRHMFCALKALNIEEIPPAMFCERWSKTRAYRVAEPATILTQKRSDLRYGSLLSRAHQLCHLAATDEEKYNQILALMESSITKLANDNETGSSDASNSRKRSIYMERSGGNIVKDPEIVRTKGSQSGKKGDKGKKRRCGHCKESGHYKSSCPNLRAEGQAAKPVDGIGKEAESTSDNLGDEDFFCDV